MAAIHPQRKDAQDALGVDVVGAGADASYLDVVHELVSSAHKQVGPAGVFSLQPIADNPERKAFIDPGPEFERASKKLGNAIGQSVLPMIIFSTPKLAMLYKTHRNPKTRVINMREIYDFFAKHKHKISEKVQRDVEQKVYDLIAGTTPGMDA